MKDSRHTEKRNTDRIRSFNMLTSSFALLACVMPFQVNAMDYSKENAYAQGSLISIINFSKEIVNGKLFERNNMNARKIASYFTQKNNIKVLSYEKNTVSLEIIGDNNDVVGDIFISCSRAKSCGKFNITIHRIKADEISHTDIQKIFGTEHIGLPHGEAIPSNVPTQYHFLMRSKGWRDKAFHPWFVITSYFNDSLETLTIYSEGK